LKMNTFPDVLDGGGGAIPSMRAHGSVTSRPDLTRENTSFLDWALVDLHVAKSVFRVRKVDTCGADGACIALLRPVCSYPDVWFQCLFDFPPGTFDEWKIVEYAEVANHETEPIDRP
jgi:hypothetical protein